MINGQSEPAPDKPNVGFPPPLVFLGLILLGMLGDRLLGLPSIPIDKTIGWIGFAGIAAGLAIIIVSIGLFRASGENPEPWTPSETIVARGPYRHTRNPMYLGMALVDGGYALWSASMGVLFTLPFSVILIDRLVIAQEERYLHARFGKAYADYCRTVRRWL